MTAYMLLPNMSGGGAERVSVSIARSLKRHGFDVKFICFCGNGGEMEEWITPEFEVEYLNCSRTSSALPKLKRYIKSQKDCVLFSSHEHVSIVALLAGKKFGIPVIVRLPNMPSNKLYKGITGLKWRIIKQLNRHLLKRARAVIAQTDAMRLEAIDLYRLPAEKVVTINNPVDKDFVTTSAVGIADPLEKGCPRYLSVGNVVERKGFDTLLEAFDTVRRRQPDATLTIVGRDTSEYAMKLKSEAGENVSFAGFEANPYPYMSHCDVFVLSSRMEGFPNVLLEAMCFDKPVASTTCVPIITQIVKPGSNGYYCEPNNPDALARCMTEASRLTGIHNSYDLFDESRLVELFTKNAS